MSHTRMTAEDVANVALDSCTDDDTSYEVEQKHESGDDVVVPATVSPHQQSSSSDEEDSSNGDVKWKSSARNSRDVLATSQLRIQLATTRGGEGFSEGGPNLTFVNTIRNAMVLNYVQHIIPRGYKPPLSYRPSSHCSN